MFFQTEHAICKPQTRKTLPSHSWGAPVSGSICGDLIRSEESGLKRHSSGAVAGVFEIRQIGRMEAIAIRWRPRQLSCVATQYPYSMEILWRDRPGALHPPGHDCTVIVVLWIERTGLIPCCLPYCRYPRLFVFGRD